MGKKLNIVFHNIVEKESELVSRYDVTADFLFEIVTSLLKVLEGKKVDLIIFLDDGHSSQGKYARLLCEKYGLLVSISLITGNIGIEGYLNYAEIEDLRYHDGITLVSHGVSHAALSRYEDGKVLPTLPGGRYRNMSRGYANDLTLEEVYYQLKESKEQLKRIGIQTEVFIYPYGIFNDEIVKFIKEKKLYSQAYTCEEDIETNETSLLAIPRVLVDNNQSVNEIGLKVKKLIEDKISS